ncbi:BBT_HP_G0131770.mRNA.1.CDS.1 [Saccharomyces cerevisiae]|nr:BBT_HP_G0131770.mRNA.1.CDS.1 [Saccharomyces cerevisiae]CAI6975442.1 BBT_HP_G0131770.mRNA.1.CDS.1 [Saccharomyces cerevisiae]
MCHCGKHSKSIFCYQSKVMKKTTTVKKYVDCLYLAPSTPIVKKKQIKCYCGNHTRANIKCSETKFPKSGKSSKDENGNRWIGVFACFADNRSCRLLVSQTFIHRILHKPTTINGEKACPFCLAL